MNVQEKILSIIKLKFDIDDIELFLTAELKNNLEIDSLSLLELIVLIEKEFGIPIYDDEIDSEMTIAYLIDLVSFKLQSPE